MGRQEEGTGMKGERGQNRKRRNQLLLYPGGVAHDNTSDGARTITPGRQREGKKLEGQRSEWSEGEVESLILGALVC